MGHGLRPPLIGWRRTRTAVKIAARPEGGRRADSAARGTVHAITGKFTARGARRRHPAGGGCSAASDTALRCLGVHRTNLNDRALTVLRVGTKDEPEPTAREPASESDSRGRAPGLPSESGPGGPRTCLGRSSPPVISESQPPALQHRGSAAVGLRRRWPGPRRRWAAGDARFRVRAPAVLGLARGLSGVSLNPRSEGFASRGRGMPVLRVRERL